jgi:hypothetical protein
MSEHVTRALISLDAAVAAVMQWVRLIRQDAAVYAGCAVREALGPGGSSR